MEFIEELLGNKVLICAFLGYFIAQVVKIIIEAFMNRTFSIWRLLSGNGGMPSSHSSTVCALAVSCVLEIGPGSPAFAVSVILAIIVMVDARGVRRETGTQAKVLNELMEFFSKLGTDQPRPQFSQQNLKELIGHTPFQVLVGALLGSTIAIAAHFMW